MTVQIDTDAVNKRVRLQQQASHFVGDPETGYSWLYVVTGTAYGGLYLETDTGAIVGPFVTGTVGTGRILIAELTPTSTGTVSISGIPAIYNNIELEWVGKSTRTQEYDELYVYFNGDTTDGNYRRILAAMSGANTLTGGGADSAQVGYVAGANAPANSCGSGNLIVINYAGTTFNKQFRVSSAYRHDVSAVHESALIGWGEWENAAAINQISMKVNSGNFATGTKIRLYGVY